MKRFILVGLLLACVISLGCQALDKDPILGNKPREAQPEFGSAFKQYSGK